MDAVPIFIRKIKSADGAITEMEIYQLPEPDKYRPHGIKYRLYYGRAGKNLVRYDNHPGKGDHKHIGEREEAYAFVSVEKLIEDFFADVEEASK